MDTTGNTAIVTGGASGLGAATARRLRAEGAKVAVLDLESAALEQIGRTADILAVPCDVADAAAAESAIETVMREFGPARILVNCAGIAPAQRVVGRDKPTDLELFGKVIAVNLLGTFNLMRLAAFHMAALDPLACGERGVIINTASIAAYEGQIGQTAYAASKGGVAGLTLPAARELARHAIRIVAIAPGLFATPMVLTMPEEVQAGVISDIPFPHRFGQPEEYADLAAYIIANQMLNGTVVRLDAALRMPAK